MSQLDPPSQEESVSTSAVDVAAPVDLSSPLVQRVMLNQLLWTAGHVLTGGAFLAWFAADLGAGGFLLSLILTLPEIASVSGTVAHPIVRRVGSRRRVYLVGGLLRSLVLVGVPLVDLGASGGLPEPVWWLVGVVAVANLISGVVFVSYLSWLSALVPQTQWGRFFFFRRSAKIAVTLVVPVAAISLRNWMRDAFPGGQLAAGYAGIFLVGVLLEAASLLPFLSVPDAELSERAQQRSWADEFAVLRARPSLICLIAHNWQLAFFNGLTQAVFYLYSKEVLGVSLLAFILLSSTMNLVKLPSAYLGGIGSDAGHDRTLLALSLIIASGGLVFWLLATPETWWLLYGAYAVWGAFAVANICGRNLLLKLAPDDENLLPLGLFRTAAGLLAGLAGLLGGLWLDKLLAGAEAHSLLGIEVNAYQLIIVISLAGRLGSLLWLTGVKSPATAERPALPA